MTRPKPCALERFQRSTYLTQSKWFGLIYNNKQNYVRFDSMLKDIDEENRSTLINFSKYKLVMFAMTKLMEM